MTYKVDFHTHSSDSPDGAITIEQYRHMLERKLLDCIAITDHNNIKLALAARKELGEAIIVGEEITAREGEVIGLFLSEVIPAGLSAAETVARIKGQGGLVYIPHPFETVRKGLSRESLDSIAADIDIVEAYNGRAVFQNYSQEALRWSKEHRLPVAAGSDSHGKAGWGKTYTMLAMIPTRDTLPELVKEASFQRGFPGIRGILYPKFNRLRHGRHHA